MESENWYAGVAEAGSIKVQRARGIVGFEAECQAWEGLVAPCVYLTLPVAGDVILRVYEGVRYQVPKTHFGDLRVSSLLEIWEQEDYRQFREPFAKRSAACGGVPFGPSGDGGFRELDGPAFDAVTRYSLPDVCRGCYKAMGL